eukprot:m.1274532 g.1274532  ORF g.1274532 m.1274532 type:complete len:71 (+) comp24758_c0_seq13:3852-4064(+)
MQVPSSQSLHLCNLCSAHKHGPKKAHPFWAHHSGSHHHLSAVTKTQTSSIADSVCEMLGCLEAPKSITLD